ncbi:MAG: ABC transporter ATP-binding protein [Eubacteriales bacterium]|nr:ABC transporter ATP-binding protein [Eubacteriales bacterium]
MLQQNKSKTRENTKTKSRLTSSFFKGNRLNWLLCLFCEISEGLLGVLLSWLIQQLMDAAVGNTAALPLPLLLWLTLGLIGLVIFIFSLRRRVLPDFLQRAMLQYKNLIYQELTRKNLASFAREESSTYLSALSNDVASIEQNYLEKSFVIVSKILVFFTSLGLMLYYSPLMTLTVIVLLLLPILASLFTGNKVAAYEKLSSDRNASFLAQLKDSLEGFSVIKAFQAEQALCKQFAGSNQELEGAKRDRRRAENLVRLISSSAGISAQLGVFIIGALLIHARTDLTLGMLMAFVNLTGILMQPIQILPDLLAKRKAAAGLIRKIENILAQNIDDQGIAIDPVLEDSLRIHDLHYAYEEGAEILQGLNLDLAAGECVALVGASGSGKSTLFQLLMGADPNYRGEICFDGQELRQVRTASLYDLLTLIQQNVFIFNASIWDNLTLYRDFPRTAVEQAIQDAGLEQLIASKGEDYLCGENGVHLSGGERQRIAIARSLLHKNSILLVDEATSSLDAETSKKISQSILKLEGLTRLVITHRLEASLLRAYDRILVLKNGTITEEGSFDQLMAAKDYFYSLYTLAQ